MRKTICQSGPSAGVIGPCLHFSRPAEGDPLPVCASNQHLVRAYYVQAYARCQSWSCPRSLSCWRSAASHGQTNRLPVLQLMTNWPSVTVTRSATKRQVSCHTCTSLPSEVPRRPGLRQVPASLLRTHSPGRTCVCFSLPCARLDADTITRH